MNNNLYRKKLEGNYEDSNASEASPLYNNNDSSRYSGYTTSPIKHQSTAPKDNLQNIYLTPNIIAPSSSNVNLWKPMTESLQTQTIQPSSPVINNSPIDFSNKSSTIITSDEYIPTNPNVYTLCDKNICKIDHKEIPRPLDNLKRFNDENESVTRYNTSEINGPLNNLDSCYIVDDGNASPKFMRTTLYQLPRFSDSLENCHIQFAIIVQPFAPTAVGQEVPLIDINESLGVSDPDRQYLIRCKNCGAYINSFVLSKSENAGKICNLCGTHYILNDHEKEVLDKLCNETYHNPRILCGSVDYLAPPSYHSRKTKMINTEQQTMNGMSMLSLSANEPSSNNFGGSPTRSIQSVKSSMTEPIMHDILSNHKNKAPSHILIIDCNKTSKSLNLKSTVLQGIKYCLSQGDINNFEQLELCIITYTNNIQFYTYKHGFKNVLIVSDDEPFIPCPLDDIFVSIGYNKIEDIFSYLDGICNFDATGDNTKECGAAAMQLAVHILAERGTSGTVTVFYANPPNISSETHGTNSFDSEIKKFYNGIVLQCYESNIAIDAYFCLPSEMLVNFASNTYLSIQTGGKFKIYSKFDYRRDYVSLYQEIYRNLTMQYAYGCELRLRCNKGLFVKDMLCPQTIPKAIVDKYTLKIPRISPDCSIAFVMGMDDIPEGRNAVYVQCACLHLNTAGKTCVRVHTLELSVTTSTNKVYKYSDVESIINIYMRTLAYNLLRFKRSIRINVLNEMVEILSAYRRLCVASTPANQLILPDSLKLLPPFCMAAFKLIALYNDTELTHIKSVLYRSLSWGVSQTMYIFPKLYSLGRDYNFIEDNVKFELVPTSGEYVYSDGMYLLDNGSEILLYFGIHVSLNVLKKLFGPNFNNSNWMDAIFINKHNDSILWADAEIGKSELAGKIQNCIDLLRKHDKSEYFKQLRVIAPKTRGEEIFKTFLIEDSYKLEPSYMNFLCDIHAKIHSMIDHNR